MRDDWNWCYRLFFSVDVIGSTSFKAEQIAEDGIPDWANTFEKLFEEFPQALIQKYDQWIQGKKPKLRQIPEIWKFVGDEILFSVKLLRHEDILYHVIALKESLQNYSEQLTKKFPRLGLKATVWGAGFPVGNASVHLKRDSEGIHSVTDYLGPSVDLGFRIAEFADKRRIPISVEVAEMLLVARQTQKRASELKIYFDQWARLKGINREQPYPILWIDRLDGETTSEDLLLGRNRECQVDPLTDIITRFIDGGSPLIRHPFIDGDPSERFGEIPDDLAQIRDRLMKDDPDRGYKESAVSKEAVDSQDGIKNATAPVLDESQLGRSRSKSKHSRTTRSKTR